MTAAAPFKPSEVLLTVPPLCGTMKRAETEYAAALIVFACTAKGDAWQPVTFADIQAAAKAALEMKEPSQRDQWARDILGIPFLRPDVQTLIKLGFAEKLSNDGEPIVVQLTPAALGAIAKRWVPGGPG